MSDKEKQNHSLLPWKLHSFFSYASGKMDLYVLKCVGKSMTGRDYTAYIHTENGDAVLEAYGATAEEAEANARLVLKRFTAHDKLVEAIKDAIAFIEREDTYSTDPEVKAVSDELFAVLTASSDRE